jgi:broad specificity phosphatase PhoE
MNQRLRLASAALALLVLIAVGVLVFWNPTTVVLLVRHAERADQSNDSPLSAEGQLRAQALAHVAEDAGVSAVFVTEFQRTQQTVAPVAISLGVTPIQITSGNVAGLAAEIRERRGTTVLVSGHSNTLPLIVAELGGGEIPAIATNQYDDLYVLHIPRWGFTRIVRLKYGSPT